MVSILAALCCFLDRQMGAARGAEILQAWKRLQVGYYGGRYSIHRLLALESYMKKTSPLRVFMVCIGTPLPMAAIIFIQESLPLQDPRDGWSANYGQWIRVTILTFVITYTSTSPVSYFIDGVNFSVQRLVLLSSCVSVILTAITLIVASCVIFPIPFSVLTMTPVYNILYIISFRFIMGNEVVDQVKAQLEQFKKYMNFLNAQILMMFVYPAYEVLFRVAKGSHYQLLVILLLPLIKVFIKNVMRRCTMHVEDMVPEAVIFTVDFFNAIYVATCMQAASSTLSILAISLTDLFQTILMLYGLHHRTVTISSKHLLNTHTAPDTENQYPFLSIICSLCRDPEKVKKQILDGIRIRSCFPHTLSPADISLFDKLNAAVEDAGTARNHNSQLAAVRPSTSTPSIADTSSRKVRCICFQRRYNSVHPGPSTFTLVNFTGPVLSEEFQPLNSSKSYQRPVDYPTFLRDSLETLFTTECLLVTSYLEAVVPLFYTAYILVMVHLPSAKYHTEMAGVTHENVGTTVFPVFVFGLLQIASFAVLVLMVQRNCRIRALYQLAFLLESQKSLIQTKLIVWMMITLCFRVMHFGVDFTFKFAGFGYKFSPSSH